MLTVLFIDEGHSLSKPSLGRVPRGLGSSTVSGPQSAAVPTVKIEEGEIADDEGEASSEDDVPAVGNFNDNIPQSSPLPPGARFGPPSRSRRSDRIARSDASNSSFLQYPPDDDTSDRRPGSAPGNLPSFSGPHFPPSSQIPSRRRTTSLPSSWESPFYKPYQYVERDRYPSNVIPPSNPFENIAYAVSLSRTFAEAEVTEDPSDLSHYYGQERIALPRWTLRRHDEEAPLRRHPLFHTIPEAWYPAAEIALAFLASWMLMYSDLPILPAPPGFSWQFLLGRIFPFSEYYPVPVDFQGDPSVEYHRQQHEGYLFSETARTSYTLENPLDLKGRRKCRDEIDYDPEGELLDAEIAMMSSPGGESKDEKGKGKAADEDVDMEVVVLGEVSAASRKSKIEEDRRRDPVSGDLAGPSQK